MADDTAIVVTGGEPVDAGIEVPPARVVIAADSGLQHAVALGLDVDLVVGDLDSVDTNALADLDVAVERHPADKDATDLELALAAARDRGARRVVVLGGAGGRIDHLLGNALLLGSAEWAGMEVEWRAAGSRALVVRGAGRLEGEPGDLVSLLPLGGPAVVTTGGLRWSLDAETLSPGTTRGISNEMTGRAAAVSVHSGTVLLIHTPAGVR